MTIDLTQLAIALLSIIGTIITSYLIPYIKQKHSKEELEKVMILAKIAVNAAEQLAKTGIIDLSERKEYALNVLKEKGVTLDIEQLSDIIESFVLELPKGITKDNKNL